MAVYIFMVVSLRQFPELPVKPVSAEIVVPAGADAVPAPVPEGQEQPVEQRKPNPWPLEEIMRRFSLGPSELLMIDDLKPGYDMARSCGVDFAAVGWANDIPQIEDFMRRNCRLYFKTVPELASWLA